MMGPWVLILVMLAILAGAVGVAYQGWNAHDVSVPTDLTVAMILGIVFSLVVGGGLMALVFYSARRGYDAPAERERRSGRADEGLSDGTKRPDGWRPS